MIIAVDAASSDLGIALAEHDGGLIGSDAWASAQRQSAELLPRLLQLLDGAGRELAETTGLAVGTGPGSFTGLRVAMALAKGLAFALGRPIVGVPSMQSWLDADPDAEAALARAGAREAYVLERGKREPTIVDRDALGALSDRPVTAPADLAEALGLERATSPRGAPAIARLATQRLAAEPAGDDLGRLEPIYFRAPRGVVDAAQGTVRWL